jgi:hypothetical protein
MTNPIKILKFSTNWNNKLDCKSFTTLRLSSKYYQGQRLVIQYQKKCCLAKIIDARSIRCSQINLFVAKLDTGYNVAETLDILGKMYKFDPYKEDKLLNFLLIERETDYYDSVLQLETINDVKVEEL